MTRYDARGLVPDRLRLLAAPYVKRDPETAEISWPPDDIELELMEQGLIPRRTK